MIKSPFTPVSIPDVTLHAVMFHALKTHADKKALVSNFADKVFFLYAANFIRLSIVTRCVN